MSLMKASVEHSGVKRELSLTYYHGRQFQEIFFGLFERSSGDCFLMNS